MFSRSPSRAIVALVLMASMSACNEVDEAYYPTLEGAIADGMVERGWLPEGLPRDASRIHVRWDLDTNATWIAFETDRAGSLRSIGGMPLVPVGTQEVAFARLGAAGWWPAALAGSGVGGDSIGRYELLRMPDRRLRAVVDGEPQFYIAVDEQRRQVFIWRPTP